MVHEIEGGWVHPYGDLPCESRPMPCSVPSYGGSISSLSMRNGMPDPAYEPDRRPRGFHVRHAGWRFCTIMQKLSIRCVEKRTAEYRML